MSPSAETLRSRHGWATEPDRAQRAEEEILGAVLRPFERFFAMEASAGLLLMGCTVVALLWANSPWRESYFRPLHAHIVIGFGRFVLDQPLELWINDGLMAIFFFVVGLEIKREVLLGELASPRKAALPIAAAIGGMIVPALIYAAINGGGIGAHGWAVPVATDIAFAVGVLALLGKRAPLGLKVFLTALAIVDDLGAVLVIALFYTSELSWVALGAVAGILAVLMVANRAGVRKPLVYCVLGIALWVAMLSSGVHATVAGVLLALTVPARSRIDGVEFKARAKALVERLEAAGTNGDGADEDHERQEVAQALERACEAAETPLQRMEHATLPWVMFGIMPIFAPANAGVTIGGGVGDVTRNPIAWGIVLGLAIGKPIGVTLFAWLSVKFGLASLPRSVGWMRIHGVSWLAGIGFTMSLFIANLAFEMGAMLDVAKIAILTGSVIAGGIGFGMIRFGKSGG